MNLSLAVLAAVAACFALAGAIKGVIGFGLPTVAIALASLVVPPTAAAAMLVVPSLATNIWQAAVGGAFTALARRLWPLLAGICVGTALGAWLGVGLLAGTGTAQAAVSLDAVLIVYGVAGLAGVGGTIPARWQRSLAGPVGVATGLVTAVTGVFVIPSLFYLQSLALDRGALVQALGMSFTVSTAALAVALAFHGLFQVTTVGTSAAFVLPTLGGMMLGQWLRRRIIEAVFRRIFFIGLMALGLHLVARGLS